MDMLWSLVAIGVMFYLIGSIPVGLLVVYILTGKDMRQYGAGNGSTVNVWRILGPEMAFLIMLGEIAKGYLVVSLATAILPAGLPVEMCLLAALLGRLYPSLIQQGRGSGILLSIGGLYGLDFPGVQILTASLILIAIFTRSKRKATLFYAVTVAISSLLFLPISHAVWGMALAGAQLELKSYKQLSHITPWANNINVEN